MSNNGDIVWLPEEFLKKSKLIFDKSGESCVVLKFNTNFIKFLEFSNNFEQIGFNITKIIKSICNDWIEFNDTRDGNEKNIPVDALTKLSKCLVELQEVIDDLTVRII